MKFIILCLLSLLFFETTLYCQSTIKEKVEVAYGFNHQDSTIRFRKTTSYDKEGRLTNKHYYYYHYTKPGFLVKEEKALFDPAKKILTETVTTYRDGQEPIQKKTETCFLDYTTSAKKHKHIWKRQYNKFNEINKEDTLSYNEQQRLIEVATYDYRGNTSLIRDHYSYNDKNQLKKWETFFCWTTINIKSEVIEDKKRQRIYRYRYNKSGKLIRLRGKYLKKRINQWIKYDKDGYCLEDKTIEKVRIKRIVNPIKASAPPKKDDSKPQKKQKPKTKWVTISNSRVKSYNKGRLTEDIIYSNKVERKKITQTYHSATETDSAKDTLPQTLSVYNDNKLTETYDYEYNEQHLLTKKKNIKYDRNGKPRYTIVTYYDDQERPIKEEQIKGSKILSTLSLKYDVYGNPVEQSLSMQNNKKLEKTTYIYKYY